MTRAALDEAWALQLTSGEQAGGWLWQDFHLAPWESGESGDSAYQGAALLMVELGSAPNLFAHSREDKAHCATGAVSAPALCRAAFAQPDLRLLGGG